MALGLLSMVSRKCIYCGEERIGFLGARLHFKASEGMPVGHGTDSLYDPHCDCKEVKFTVKEYNYENKSQDQSQNN